jgi:hypothetical protein
MSMRFTSFLNKFVKTVALLTKIKTPGRATREFLDTLTKERLLTTETR